MAAAELAGQVVRCESCFQIYLREADLGFLDNFAEFGAVSHRVVAETAIRGLVTASPPERKVLSMAVFEQFLQAAGDLIGLYAAIKDRRHRPLVESFLNFELDAARTRDFFADLEELDGKDLLTVLGLPEPEEIAGQHPDWDEKDLGYAANALWRALNGVKRCATSGILSERALLQARREIKRNMPVTSHSSWLRDGSLAANEVGTMILDYKRRRIALNSLTVDEGELNRMLDAIDTLSQAAGDLAYAYFLLGRAGDDFLQIKPPDG